MTTRVQTIPSEALELQGDDRVSSAEVRDGQILVTIVSGNDDLPDDSGDEFLRSAREIQQIPVDSSIWTDPDPRLREILDHRS
ncbi:MAG: hypothetical protein AAF236_13365 [Verrucomicrobiota bacterium]